MTVRTDLQLETYNELKDEELSFEAVVTRYNRSNYNSSTGLKTETSANYTGYGVFKKISESKSIPDFYEIKQGDKAFLGAFNGFEPKNKDKISIDSNDYTVGLSIDYSLGNKALFFLIIN